MLAGEISCVDWLEMEAEGNAEGDQNDQCPMSKHQRMTKAQCPRRLPPSAIPHWNLGLGTWAFFGIWYLDIGHSFPIPLICVHLRSSVFSYFTIPNTAPLILAS